MFSLSATSSQYKILMSFLTQLVVVFVSSFTKLIFSFLNALPQNGEECKLCNLIKNICVCSKLFVKYRQCFEFYGIF